MKGWLSALMFLMVVLAVCMARAQEPEPSLADVARQSRLEKKTDSKVVVTDQVHDVPDSKPPDSLCGAPIPAMQDLYAAAYLGQKTPPEDQLTKELLAWLDAHPELQKMDPEDLAKTDEPRTDAEIEADKNLANRIAQSFTDEMVEFKNGHTEQEVQEQLTKVMSAKAPQRQADALATAVRDEKQRRANAAENLPSEKDRLEQAINLYAICENKRLINSQGEVETMTKAALREKLAAAGFAVQKDSEGTEQSVDQ